MTASALERSAKSRLFGCIAKAQRPLGKNTSAKTKIQASQFLATSAGFSKG